MTTHWRDRYSLNMKDYPGYAIGKLLALIEDPEIISLAGGLPSPRMFLQTELRVNFSFPSRDQIREAVRRLSDCLESRFFDEGGGAEG